MERSEQINELAVALAKAQGEFKVAKKNADNPFFKRKYADMASVTEATQEALAKYGLAVIQNPTVNGNCVEVETLIVHGSGQWVMGKLPSETKDKLPQAIGTVITYIRRYAKMAMLGVSAEGEDDDGNEASGVGSPAKKGAKPDVKPSIDKPAPAGCCEVCHVAVSDDVKAFSTKKFNKILCMTHQPKATK